MSEWSKKVGEYGEDSVEEFMRLIGWNHPQKGIDIRCKNADSHTPTSNTRDRTKHGIDFIHHQKSPFFEKTLDVYCISAKYKGEKYPDNPKNDFKNHLTDLAQAMECFEKSDEYKRIKQNKQGVNNARVIGVLVWFQNNKSNSEYEDLLSRVSNIQLPKDKSDFSHPIFLVDNSQANFLNACHEYIDKNYREYETSYLYQKTGNNNASDTAHYSSGDSLGVELLTSQVIIHKAEATNLSGNIETTLIITTGESFSESNLSKLVGLAHDLTQNLSSNIDIVFSDYNPLHHDNEKNGVLMNFDDGSFTKRVKVSSLNYKIYR